MKRIVCLFLILSMNHVMADDHNYDIGNELATCSGVLKMSSQIVSTLDSVEMAVTHINEKANGWLIASIVFFIGDGMSVEGAWSSAEGIRDTSMTYWLARTDSANKIKDDEESINALNTIVNEVHNNAIKCLEYNEIVEAAIKEYRRKFNSS